MKKVLIGVGVVLGLVVAAIAIVPAVIDWSSYRAQVAEQLTNATGRPVRIEGELGAQVLPMPAFTVAGLRIENPDGTPFASVGRVEARVALLPLLGGAVQVQEIRIVRPDIVIETGGDAATGDATPPIVPGNAPAGAPASGGESVRVDSLRIEDGVVRIRDRATGAERTIAITSALVSADSMLGPFTVAAGIEAQSIPLRVQLTTSRMTDAGALPLRANVTVAETGASLRYSGLIVTRGAVGAQGELQAEGPNLEAVLQALAIQAELPPVVRAPFSMRGRLAADTDKMTLSELDLRLADMGASGSLAAAYGSMPPSVEATLAVNRIDLAGLIPPASGPRPATSQPPPATGTPQQGPATPFAFPDLQGRVDLSVDAIQHNGQAVRQLRLIAALRDDVLTVEQLSAGFPGGGDVRVTGSVAEGAAGPTIAATLEASSDNLRALLAWLEVEPTGIAADRLVSLQASARMMGTPAAFQATDIDVSLDTMRLRGALSVARGDRLGLGARIAIDQVNVDAYRAMTTAAGSQGSGGPSAPAGNAGLDPLAEIDANLQLSIGTLVANGQTIRDLVLNGTLARGTVTVSEARIGNWAGLSGSMQGRVENVAATPGPVDMTVAVRGQGVAEAARALGLQVPPPIEAMGPIALTGRLGGTAQAVDVTLNVEALRGTLQAAGRIEPPNASTDLRVRLALPETGDAIRLASPDWRPAGPPLGPLDVFTHVRADARGATIDEITAQVGPVSAKGEMTLAMGDQRPRITANLQTGEIPVDRFLGKPATATPAPAPTGGPPPSQPLPFETLRALDGELNLTAAAISTEAVTLSDVAARIILADGTLTIEQLDAGVLGGRVGLTGQAIAGRPGDVPQVAAKASVVAVQLPRIGAAGTSFALGRGLAEGAFDLSARGDTTRALLGTLVGTAQASVDEGVITGLNIGAIAERLRRLDNPLSVIEGLNAAVTGGSTAFDRMSLTARIDNGVVRTDDLRVGAPFAVATGVGEVDLARWTMNMRTLLDVEGDIPPFGLNLTGPIDQPRRTLDTDALRDVLVERARQGVLDRLVPGAGGAGTSGTPTVPGIPVPGLGSILGGSATGGARPEAQPEQPAQPSRQQQPVQREDVIRDVFRGLAR